MQQLLFGDDGLSGILIAGQHIANLLDDLFVERLALLMVVFADAEEFFLLFEVFIGNVDDVLHAEVILENRPFEVRDAAQLVVPSTAEDAPPVRITVVGPAGRRDVDGEAKTGITTNDQAFADVVHSIVFVHHIRLLNVFFGGAIFPLGRIQMSVDEVFLVYAPTAEHRFAMDDAFNRVAFPIVASFVGQQHGESVAEITEVSHDLLEKERHIVTHIPVVGWPTGLFDEVLDAVVIRIAHHLHQARPEAIHHLPVKIGVGTDDFGLVDEAHHLLWQVIVDAPRRNAVIRHILNTKVGFIKELMRVVFKDNQRLLANAGIITQPDNIVTSIHRNTSSPLNRVTVLRFTVRNCPLGSFIFIVFPEEWKLVQLHSSTVTNSPLLATNWSEKELCACTSSNNLLSWIMDMVFGLLQKYFPRNRIK